MHPSLKNPIVTSIPRPNLFIIGAMKAGTTSLHSYLDSHPQVFMCRPKEPMFFSRQENLEKGEEWYLDLFSSAGEALIIGESSTEYTKTPVFSGVARRIAKFNPEARFIYIMRDPIERTISHYWLMVRTMGERRDMLEAIINDPHYMDVSHYAMQLAPYLELFARDKIAALTLENLRTNTSEVLCNLFEWLGVDSSHDPSDFKERKNVTPRYVRQDRGFRFFSAFRRSPYWKAMKPLVPRPCRSIGRRLLGEEIDRTSISVDKVVDFLRPIQLEQTEALCKMLGRRFPEWTALYGTTSILDPARKDNCAS